MAKNKKLKGNIFDAFQKLKEDFGIQENNTEKAIRWFRKTVQENVKQDDPATIRKILRDNVRANRRNLIGKMYAYSYLPDSENRDKLPYYDTFPLIFLVQNYNDKIFGVNLHYLPYVRRTLLFTRLLKLASNQRMDETTRIKLSYGLLKNESKFKASKKCFRMYKKENIRSRIINIPSQDWAIALYLPVERFKKATRETIWGENR
jgi:hypothetical protein